MMPGRTPQEAVQIEHRRRQVAELYLMGLPQTTIAHRLNVAQSTVSADLKAIRRSWKESAIRDFDEARGIELARIDKLESEAWDAWERSKADQEETKLIKDSKGNRAEKTTRARVGESRFLDIVYKCVASRRSLLGLDAPTRIAPTSPDGDESYHAHVMKEFIRLAEQAKDGPEIIDADYVDRQILDLPKQVSLNSKGEKDE